MLITRPIETSFVRPTPRFVSPHTLALLMTLDGESDSTLDDDLGFDSDVDTEEVTAVWRPMRLPATAEIDDTDEVDFDDVTTVWFPTP